MIDSQCKICRRAGEKLFLKGEKCFSPKCLMVRKPYPPGQKRKRRFSSLSDYGKELKEKQRLKNWYNLQEKQLRKYVKEALQKRGKVEDTSSLLIRKLESRLDNVVLKLGFAKSKAQARQMIGHRFFLVNGKKINIPSYQVKKGDKISIAPLKIKKNIFQNINITLKKHQVPSWIEINREKLEGRIVSYPSVEEAALPIEIPLIFEFYSK